MRPVINDNDMKYNHFHRQEQGVKIFVLLYKEIEAALTIKSVYSKQKLMAHCPENIKVIHFL